MEDSNKHWAPNVVLNAKPIQTSTFFSHVHSVNHITDRYNFFFFFPFFYYHRDKVSKLEQGSPLTLIRSNPMYWSDLIFKTPIPVEMNPVDFIVIHPPLLWG